MQASGNQFTGFFRPRRASMKRRMNSLIQSLVLVRIGQELGTDSDIAQAVASGIDLLVSTLARFLG
jgi:hypothetical protein